MSCPFEHPQGRRFLTQEKRDFNQALSSVQIAVEQAFGDIQVQWTYTAFAKGLTTGKQPIAAYFTVAVLLTTGRGPCIQEDRGSHCRWSSRWRGR